MTMLAKISGEFVSFRRCSVPIVTSKEDRVGGRARVTIDEERMTAIKLWRY